jgi:aminopeptidase N
MEQFPLREMIPLMIDDFKPNIWPISYKNLTNNEQILDYLSLNIYSKGASLLRLIEYIVGIETFQTAVRSSFLINDLSNVLNTFYSSFDTLLNTTITIEEFLRSWIEERNYPFVTIDFIPANDINTNITLIFHQTRYLGSFGLNESLLDQNYTWKIYMECDLGGIHDGADWNYTGNYAPSKLKFIFETSTHIIDLPNEEYLWIKCNKNFYSYQITEYISDEDIYLLWRTFELLFKEVCEIFFI